MKFQILSILALVAAVAFTSCKKDEIAPKNSITDVVLGAENFSTLKAAVTKAGLGPTLSTGTYTVFAPDNDAFAAKGITLTSLQSIFPATLEGILLYHTVPAKVMSGAIATGRNAKVITANGDSIFVSKNANGVFVNGVKVVRADIPADNGVIHQVAKVLESPTENIVQKAVSAHLDSLVKAVLRSNSDPNGIANLATILSTSSLTVFAPTNQAFTELLQALNLRDINQIPIATLNAVLAYHLVPGRYFASDLTSGSLTMFASGSTNVGVSPTGVTIRGTGNGGSNSNVVAADVMCKNGVVHVINRVLLP